MNNQRTSLFLMANLGAEVSRMISAKEKLDISMMKGAVERARGIVKKINVLPDMIKRIPELNILSDVLNDFVVEKPTLSISTNALKSYFTPFITRLSTVA